MMKHHRPQNQRHLYYSIRYKDIVRIPINYQLLREERWNHDVEVVHRYCSTGLFYGDNPSCLPTRRRAGWRSTKTLIYKHILGGFPQMTAYQFGQLSGNHGGNIGAMYYYRLGGLKLLTQTPFYLGGLLEVGNAWNQRSDMSFDDLHSSAGG